MFAHLTHCIYCLTRLSEERSGVGEHIIPRSIYGFWRSHDVCSGCMAHFGEHVDGLAAESPVAIRAMQRLDLPPSERLARNLPYQGTDRLTGERIPYALKPADFVPKVVQEGDDVFQCPQEQWRQLGIPFLRDATSGRVGAEAFETEVTRLSTLYDELPEGGVVESEALGYAIRKGSLGAIEVNTEAVAPISPLIAKISVAFAWLVLQPRQIANLREIQQLTGHARYGESIPAFFVNWCPLKRAPSYARFHRLRAYFSASSLLIDVTLFGYANWRVPMRSEAGAISAQDTAGRPLAGVELVLDFSSPTHRVKYVGVQPHGSGKLEYYVLTH